MQEAGLVGMQLAIPDHNFDIAHCCKLVPMIVKERQSHVGRNCLREGVQQRPSLPGLNTIIASDAEFNLVVTFERASERVANEGVRSNVTACERRNHFP